MNFLELSVGYKVGAASIQFGYKRLSLGCQLEVLLGTAMEPEEPHRRKWVTRGGL